MSPAMSHGDWAHVCQELISRNSAYDGHLYMQVSRGAEFGRNHAWPEGLKPTLFAYCTELDPLPAALIENGVAAVTATETRWARRDIKATALLANILLKKLAADAGAFETIMLENGELTEGSSTTVHVVKDGVIHTPPNGHHILPGTTRDVITELAELLSIRNSSVAVPETALRGADEVWLAFSTRGVLPVTKLDGAAVGSGLPGPLFKRIHLAFANYVRELGKTPAL